MNYKVSVIMSVYNGEINYLDKAIDSLLHQTYQNLEIIIIDDGSNSNIKRYLNKKVKENENIYLYTNNENIGLTKSLNLALEKATGKFIARMDADDVCNPKRIELQVSFLEKHPSIDVIGSLAKKIGDNEGLLEFGWNVDDHETNRFKILFNNSGLIHPSIMIRSDFLEKYSINYREEMLKSQDYGLWIDVLKYGKIACIQQPLIQYRIHSGQISSNNCNQKRYVRVAREDEMKSIIRMDQDSIDYFHKYSDNQSVVNKDFFKWFNKFERELISSGHYDPRVIKVELTKKLVFNMKNNISNTSVVDIMRMILSRNIYLFKAISQIFLDKYKFKKLNRKFSK